MITTALQRLLKYPHAAVFDTSPHPELALRIRNPTGLTWSVSGSTLQLITGIDTSWDGSIEFDGQYNFGVTIRDYSLAGKTVGQLAQEIEADGHQVIFLNPDLARRGALVLVEAMGAQAETNGDHLYSHTSLLWTLFGGYAQQLDEAGFQVRQALRQMVLTQAEDEWLDRWANLYGVPRQISEGDGALQARIPTEVFRLRVNGLAMEQAVKDITGQVIKIDEPWRRMFRLDESALSGVDRLHDGSYYSYHVIQPVGSPGTDWSTVIPILLRNKAAGVDLYAPRVEFSARHITVQPPVEYLAVAARSDLRSLSTFGTNNQVLGVLRLDDEPPIINHLAAAQWLWMLSTTQGFQTEQQIVPTRSVARASICLSEGAAFGDENFVLSRGQSRTVFVPEPILSEQMMLSHYTASTVVEIVDFISIAEHHVGAESSFTAFGNLAHTDVFAFATVESYPERSWTGAWDAMLWTPDWRHAGMKRTDTAF